MIITRGPPCFLPSSLQRHRVADFPVRVQSQIKASEAKEAAKNKPAEPKQQGSVAKKTTPSRPAESTPRATTGGKTMGAKGRAGQILLGEGENDASFYFSGLEHAIFECGVEHVTNACALFSRLKKTAERLCLTSVPLCLAVWRTSCSGRREEHRWQAAAAASLQETQGWEEEERRFQQLIKRG